MRPAQIKMFSATVGAAAVLAMGGLTVAFSTVSSAQPEPSPAPVPTESTPTTTITTRDEGLPEEPPTIESTVPGPTSSEEEEG